MSVVLYSTHCPRCNVLEKKLQQKNISYEEVNDVNIMEGSENGLNRAFQRSILAMKCLFYVVSDFW